MVWADIDDETDGDALKDMFWQKAKQVEVTQVQFSQVVFIFAKDRLENWIQFLNEGQTDENLEGPRVKFDKHVADAAKTLANRCKSNQVDPPLPPSLEWSCRNWRELVARIQGH